MPMPPTWHCDFNGEQIDGQSCGIEFEWYTRSEQAIKLVSIGKFRCPPVVREPDVRSRLLRLRHEGTSRDHCLPS